MITLPLRLAAVLVLCLLALALRAQCDTLRSVPPVPAVSATPADSLPPAPPRRRDTPYRFKWRQLLLPAPLVVIGILGTTSDWAERRVLEVKNELQEEVGSPLHLDDYTQYAPAAFALGLGCCGVRARHNLAERAILLATAYALMGATVNTMKATTHVMRPDGSSSNSFPSGHTATAFMGAELLRREYWEVSPWIGVAGYAVAAGTGFFRMYNNRHWLTDVLAGAGIGVFSAEAAYWLFPVIERTFFPRLARRNVYLSPDFSARGKGLALCFRF